MRIGLDVDGVLYQWSATARAILNRKHGITITESETWNWVKEHCTPEQWKSLWEENMPELYTAGLYYPGAQQAVKILVAENHEVILITATPEAVRAARAQVLFEDFPDISGLIYIPVLSTNKTAWVKCDMYLDDKPETAAETARAGHRSLLQDRPWNQGVSDPGVTRIFNWSNLHVESNR
jgi:uncharacterized HAD superfamily protein